MLVPLMVTDMRAELDDRVLATDASTFGGGVVEGYQLTAAGRLAAMEEMVRPRELSERGVIVIELFAGISGCRAAFERLGVPVIAMAICELDREARRVGRERWPGSFEWIDVRAIGRKEIELLRKAAPGATCVCTAGGSPCQDLSSLNVLGQGLEGHRSSLFWEIPRLEAIISEVFGDLRRLAIAENVASMP